MTGATGTGKYQHLPSWESWDQTPNLTSKHLPSVNPKPSDSAPRFDGDDAQTPAISFRLCSPWGNLEQSPTESSDGAYSKPGVWKRILRKLRADARRIRVACCEGLCWPRAIPDYNSFNYNRNFDDGRSDRNWPQYSTLRLSGTASLPSATESERTWNSSADAGQFALHSTLHLSGTASLPSVAECERTWKSSADVSQFAVRVDPVWQRRKPTSPSKLRVKKVTFVDT